MTISIRKIIAAGVAVLAFGIFSPCAAQDRRVIVLGLDETGSYTFRSKAIDIAAGVIGEMQPGDVLYVRRITDKSYDDACAVFRLSIPEVSPPPRNRFNPRERQAWEQGLRMVEMLKAKAVQALKELAPVKAKKTDIIGFLKAAEDRFRIEPSGTFSPIVVITSDMQDNRGLKVSLDLVGAEIWIAGFQPTDDPVATGKAKSEWQRKLQAGNASKVTFVPTDCRVSLNENP
jgi:hypothetical protein